jgi:hypothetical protein
MSDIRTLTYTSWGHFKADLIPDLFGNEEFQRSRFLFRGQMDSNWKLESNLERIRVADQLLAMFKHECERLQVEDAIRTNDLSLLALGQHFGLPTRLLDWTESPYTAVFLRLAITFLVVHHPARYVCGRSIATTQFGLKRWESRW